MLPTPKLEDTAISFGSITNCNRRSYANHIYIITQDIVNVKYYFYILLNKCNGVGMQPLVSLFCLCINNNTLWFVCQEKILSF